MPELINARVETCIQHGQKAGAAHLHENLLRFNAQLYLEKSKDFLKQTVAHEIAYLIAHQLFGDRITRRGEEWKLIMCLVYELPPDSCYTYAVKRRNIEHYIYRCPCLNSDITFSAQRHRLVRQGRGCMCRHCRNILMFNGETQVG